jgi:pyruvate dehydrogenase E1 component beta subunit
MSDLTFAEALREALREEMERDERVIVLGEEVGEYGGTFTVTRGLLEQFGEKRVIDTPLSESAIAGATVGSALMGIRPVGEIMFADNTPIAMDQIINSAAKARYLYGGAHGAPLVFRTSQGATGRGMGPHHSQCLEAVFMHIPGLIVVLPSNPADAKGLLKSSIRCDDPVVFLETKSLYFIKGPVPEGEHLVPLRKADIKRQGKDVTVVATGSMVQKALNAAETLDKEGINIEVIDPRTLSPLDTESIIGSVHKTGRLVTVEEAHRNGSFGSSVASLVVEEAFKSLKAPVKRVAGPDVPVPANKFLESVFVPNEEKITNAVRAVLS